MKKVKIFTKHTVSNYCSNAVLTSDNGEPAQNMNFIKKFGELNKKFSYKRFKELLLEIHTLSMKEQHEKIDETLNNWKKDFEQIDDILIIGIKV